MDSVKTNNTKVIEIDLSDNSEKLYDFLTDEYIQKARGPVGLQGTPGSAGLIGPPGVDGTPGIQGKPGKNGENNTTTGAQGSPGARGSAGPQGLRGVDGLDGAPGIQGTQGIQGAQGPPGCPAQDLDYSASDYVLQVRSFKNKSGYYLVENVILSQGVYQKIRDVVTGSFTILHQKFKNQPTQLNNYSFEITLPDMIDIKKTPGLIGFVVAHDVTKDLIMTGNTYTGKYQIPDTQTTKIIIEIQALKWDKLQCGDHIAIAGSFTYISVY